MRITLSKLREKFSDISHEEKKLHEFFQIFPIISFPKKCEKPNVHNLRLFIQYGGYRIEILTKSISDQVLSYSKYKILFCLGADFTCSPG